MSKSVFRFFNPDGPKEDPIQKRRGQLRRAQRSYRDRKERYTKLLETDLAQTRANEAKLIRECEGLRASLQNALEMLSQKGINHPHDMMGLSLPLHHALESSPETAEPSIQDSLDQFQFLEESEPSSQLLSPESLGTYVPSEYQDDSFAMVKHKRNTIWPSDAIGGTKICEMDQITVGMEFVLKIEEPCLGHLHGDPNKPDEPNGHALTASSQLLCVPGCQAPTATDGNINPSCSPPPLYQNAPAAMLERLLRLAPDLSADGEITPVQAWNSIRRRPQFGGLDIERLRTLSENLRKAVKCHGFGAVVQKSVFDSLVYDTIMLGQSF